MLIFNAFTIFGNFPHHLENIQAIRKLSRKLSRPSRKYSDYLEIFQTVRKLPSELSRVTRKNFPDAQKLSKWQCHHATRVFGPLGQGGRPQKGKEGAEVRCGRRWQGWPWQQPSWEDPCPWLESGNASLNAQKDGLGGGVIMGWPSLNMKSS